MRADKTEIFNAQLRTEVERVKKDSFNDDYQATDAEAMGIILARFYSWDGIEILATAEAALEDANFHKAAGDIAEIRERESQL